MTSGKLIRIAKEMDQNETTCLNTETMSTLEYMSPETLNASVYYKESDIYSFGVLAYETITETDFTKLKGFQIIFAVTNGTYRPDMKELEGLNEITALLEDTWNKNWKKRPSFETICNRLARILEKCKSIKSLK